MQAELEVPGGYPETAPIFSLTLLKEGPRPSLTPAGLQVRPCSDPPLCASHPPLPSSLLHLLRPWGGGGLAGSLARGRRRHLLPAAPPERLPAAPPERLPPERRRGHLPRLAALPCPEELKEPSPWLAAGGCRPEGAVCRRGRAPGAAPRAICAPRTVPPSVPCCRMRHVVHSTLLWH